MCYTHIYIFYASVQATAVAEGIMLLGCQSVRLYVHPIVVNMIF